MRLLLIGLAAVFLALDRVLIFMNQDWWSAFPKCCASLCYLLLGYYCFFHAKDKSPRFKVFGIKILVALSLAFIADISIEFTLMAGFVVFMLAHIAYIIAFMDYKHLTPTNLTTILLLLAGIFCMEYFMPVIDFGPFFVPIIIYGIIIIPAAVLSFGCFHIDHPLAKLISFEGAVFLFSDLILQFEINQFSSIPHGAKMICGAVSNVFYYVSQFIPAYALSEDFLKADKIEE